METGEAYKGDCWCAGPTVCPAALERLVGHLLETRCLCPICLQRIADDPTLTREQMALRE